MYNSYLQSSISTCLSLSTNALRRIRNSASVVSRSKSELSFSILWHQLESIAIQSSRVASPVQTESFTRRVNSRKTFQLIFYWCGGKFTAKRNGKFKWRKCSPMNEKFFAFCCTRSHNLCVCRCVFDRFSLLSGMLLKPKCKLFIFPLLHF